MGPLDDHKLSRFLNPLAKAWTSKFKRAREAKKEFQEVADQCRIFFKGSATFWESQSKGGCYTKFMDQSMRPNRDPVFDIRKSVAHDRRAGV